MDISLNINKDINRKPIFFRQKSKSLSVEKNKTEKGMEKNWRLNDNNITNPINISLRVAVNVPIIRNPRGPEQHKGFNTHRIRSKTN